MKPILFDKTATTFTTNGLGRLDCHSCKVTEERNGIYELEMEIGVSALHADQIEMTSIIVVKASQNSGLQAFRVYRITKPLNGVFKVYAQHISYQLSMIPTMPFEITASASACAQTLAALKSNAVETCPFTFTTDVTTVASYSQTTPSSIRSRLGGVQGSVLDQFGGEYEWDNYNVTLHEDRGVTTPTVTLRYGKNITDIEQEENIANTITGIVPFWSDNENGTVVTLPEKVINSAYASSFPYKRTVAHDFSDDFDEQPTEAQLRTKAQAYVTSIGVPVVSIKLSFVNLADTEEYKDIAPLQSVNLCDVITVQFEKYNISTNAKIVKTVYDVLAERYDSLEIGSLRSSLATTIQEQNADTITSITSKFQKVGTEIDNATAWLTSSGGYVVAVKNADGSWKELLFLDDDDIDTAVNVLRINENGIGFSSNGVSGPYTQAWTLDGRLVIGGTNVPSITVYDANNSIIFQASATAMIWNATNSSMDSTGVITMSGAKLSGGYIEQTDAFGGTIRFENGYITLFYNGTAIGSMGVTADINHNGYFEVQAYTSNISNTHNCDIRANNNTWVSANNLLSLSATETGGSIGINADDVLDIYSFNGNVNISAGGTLDLSANAITVAGNATSNGDYVESLDTTQIDFVSNLNVTYDTIHNVTVNINIDFYNQSASWSNVDFTYVNDVSWMDNSMDIYDSYTTRSFIDGLAT